MAISERLPFERALNIVKRMHSGESITVARISTLYGVSRRQAYRIMIDIELALPVVAVKERPLTLKWKED